MALNTKDTIRTLFLGGVDAALPRNLLLRSVHIQEGQLIIQNMPVPPNLSIHVVGFGKAVYAMAVALVDILGDRISGGILSIPKGYLSGVLGSVAHDVTSHLRRFAVYEGAANNIPDEDSLLAAKKIVQFVSSLSDSDLLIVLIGGGGSALLPYPVEGVLLKDKIDTIKLLSQAGSTILDLNTIRRKLSKVKGGGLLRYCTCNRVFTLIISDVVGDPLDVIASGPTVRSIITPEDCASILSRYNLSDKICDSIKKRLEEISDPPFSSVPVENLIIGSNKDAARAVEDLCRQMDIIPLVVSTTLQGNCRELGRQLAFLASYVNHPDLYGQVPGVNRGAPWMCASDRLRATLSDKSSHGFDYVCLIAAGETTVSVSGTGKGGRCQELALAASLTWHELNSNYAGNSLAPDEMLLLAAGTDGIDGPCDAAGALSFPGTVEQAARRGLDAEAFLVNNDSYAFFSALDDGAWHFKSGHTGTNVMDLILVIIKVLKPRV